MTIYDCGYRYWSTPVIVVPSHWLLPLGLWGTIIRGEQTTSIGPVLWVTGAPPSQAHRRLLIPGAALPVSIEIYRGRPPRKATHPKQILAGALLTMW